MASYKKRSPLPALLLAAAVMLALLGPVTADQHNYGEVVTTGHTTFLDASTTFNKCFAGIAGALMQRVTWFNGATLFSRMTDGSGETYMYAMEHFNTRGEDGRDNETGVEPFDPSKETLYETGQEYAFHDKNNPNLQWRVVEYYALKDGKDDAPLYSPTDGERMSHPGQEKVYVYVVRVGEAVYDPEIDRDYNFVMVVDTCKFLHGGSSLHHEGEFQGDQKDPQYQHNEEDGQHDHREFAVDLFVGGAPQSVPLPADPDHPPENATEGGSDDGGSAS